MFRTWTRRRKRALAIALAALVVLIGLLVWRFWPRPAALSGTLLVQQAGAITRLSLPDGTPEPMTFDLPDEVSSNIGSLSVARDGSRLAFVGTQSGPVYRVFVANLDGSGVRPVSAGPRDSQPAIAPDGSQVVFVRSRDFFSALFHVDLATGEERQLTDYTNDLEPNWAPDGSRIVFTTSRDGFQELYTMAPDGSDQRRLTANEGLNDLRAVYSPDGTQLAYMTNRSVGDGTGEIWVMDADGSNQRRLTDNALDDRSPTWSPDGRYIGITTSTLPPDIQTRIAVYDLETDRLRLLTEFGDTGAFGLTWSPDGKWIAYLERFATNRYRLMAVRPDGTDRRVLLESVSATQPVWLSD